MAAKKPLNIGLVGYGFMGRTHSNAYKRVNDFFDLDVPPGAQGRLRPRRAEGAKAFAEKWGYESVETDWRKLVERKDIDAIDICTPNNTHAEIAIAAAAGGQDDPLREAAGDEPGRGPEDGRRGREGRRAQHRLVQLPPRARPSRWPSS